MALSLLGSQLILPSLLSPSPQRVAFCGKVNEWGQQYLQWDSS
jgi:hypothetical protein